jgi:hypothetical protein
VYKRLAQGARSPDTAPELARELVLIKRELVRRSLTEAEQFAFLERIERDWRAQDEDEETAR